MATTNQISISCDRASLRTPPDYIGDSKSDNDSVNNHSLSISPSSQDSPCVPRGAFTCLICGRVGHLSSDCKRNWFNSNEAKTSSLCTKCGKPGHKAYQCRLSRSRLPTKWHKRQTLVSQSRQHALEEMLGAADAKVERMQEEKDALPDKPVDTNVKAVDFPINLPFTAFTVYSEPLGYFAGMISDLDGNHLEDQAGNPVLRAYTWKHISNDPMEVNLDQRPVQFMGFETYKKDANIQTWQVERAWRMSNVRSVLRTGKTMATHVDRIQLSMTMVSNMIARDGVRRILSASDEFVEARYDIISTSVNIPQLPGIKENTITFLRDLCQHYSSERHLLPFDDVPHFHVRLLAESATVLPMAIDGGKSQPWVVSNPFAIMSGFATSIVSITWIFLVLALDAMWKGPFSLARTLTINVRYTEASPSGLVVNYLKFISLCFVSFVLSLGVGLTNILYLCLPILIPVLTIGWPILRILLGVQAKLLASTSSVAVSLLLDILNVRALLNVRVITAVVVLSRKLVPLILGRMHLRPLVDQYLLRLRNRFINYPRLLNTCLWPIGLDT